jgi:hypothetical protein
MAISLWPTGYDREGISPYPRGTLNREIDLRQEFIDLIDGTPGSPQRGHWVLLRRMDTRQRCSCWKGDSTKYDEPNANCPICLGEGWVYQEELHKVRRRVVTPPPGMAGMESQTEFAIMSVPYLVYYFKYHVRPTELDRIIEIDNTEQGQPVRPFVRGAIYNITFAEPFRDINGRIEYWRCAVKKEEFRHGGSG